MDLMSLKCPSLLQAPILLADVVEQHATAISSSLYPQLHGMDEPRMEHTTPSLAVQVITT
jgi:hypothetical protein